MSRVTTQPQGPEPAAEAVAPTPPPTLIRRVLPPPFEQRPNARVYVLDASRNEPAGRVQTPPAGATRSEPSPRGSEASRKAVVPTPPPLPVPTTRDSLPAVRAEVPSSLAEPQVASQGDTRAELVNSSAPPASTALTLSPEQEREDLEIEWELSSLHRLVGGTDDDAPNAGPMSGVRNLTGAQHRLAPFVRTVLDRLSVLRARVLEVSSQRAAELRVHVRARPLRALLLSALAGFLVAWLTVGTSNKRVAPAPTLKLTLQKVEAPKPPPVAPAPEVGLEEEAGSKKDVRRASALVSEGNGLRRTKQLEEAEARYRAALRAYPGYPRALGGLALVALDRGNGQDAVRYARALVRARPKLAANHRILGDALKAAGNLDEARRSWTFAARRGDKEAKRRLKP